MRFKEHVERASGWIDSSIMTQIQQMGADPAFDKRRVTEAMNYGWRYTEAEGVPPERYLGALQTSAWFNIDSDMLDGVLQGADPTIDELPPLPFPRIALDARWALRGTRSPLFAVSLEESQDASHHLMHAQKVLYPGDPVPDATYTLACATMIIFEIQQGMLWDVMTTMTYIDRHKNWVRNPTFFGFHVTSQQHLADHDGWRKYNMFGWSEDEKDTVVEFDTFFGHLVWKTAVSAAHIITATNIRNVRVLPKRKQMRDLNRRHRYAPIEARIYRVDINQNTLVTSGASDREFHCRWMVRGHYRRTAHGEYRHPVDGSPASWVRAHIKGPAGAPWKGRPYHVKEEV
jgi:hypothetical protein